MAQPKVMILLAVDDSKPYMRAIGPVTRFSPDYAKCLKIIREKGIPYIDTQVLIESPSSFILNEELPPDTSTISCHDEGFYDGELSS